MWTDESFTGVVESLLEEYAAFPPELVFSYSNLGYSLLGHLVAVVSGQPLERYMDTHVLGPLRMTDTRFLARPSPASAWGITRGRADRALAGARSSGPRQRDICCRPESSDVCAARWRTA
ncbi:serine hydrolase [Thiocapsa sp. C4-3m]|uniref:serine hydrolase n=1 Tax=Thiocapsa sp. C4-3m TaxID=3137393 RepID=UPI0035AF5C06